MSAATKICRDRVLAEIDALPQEYLPFLLQMMRAFRESVTLKPAVESFRQVVWLGSWLLVWLGSGQVKFLKSKQKCFKKLCF